LIIMLQYLGTIIAAIADILSGWLALHSRMKDLAPRYLIAFAAGMLVSVAFFSIIPEADIGSNSIYLGLGFLVFYVLERVMMIHACGERECETHTMGTVTVFGMALDNVVDGIGIVIGFAINPILGAVITAAVVIHEIPQGMTSALIMQNAGYARRKIFSILGLAGALYPIGAAVSSFIPAETHPAILAFIAGDFIYIGASDLLPEAHKKFNFRVIFSVILGAVFVLALRAFFPIA